MSMMLLHQRQHQRSRPQPRSSCLLFVLMLLSSWLCSSAHAVLTEDDIIKKEVAWVAKTRKAYRHGFYAVSPGNGDDDSRTQLQRQDDHIHLRKQEEEQSMRQQQQQQQQQQQREETPPTVITISRPNLRGPSTDQLR
jgi:hypothetical protein